MGKDPSLKIPRPSRPRKLLPNDERVPSCSIATVEARPTPTAIVSFNAGSSIGEVLASPVIVPSPSLPEMVVPQPQTVPSDLTAYDVPSPAMIRTTFVRPGTCTGVACATKSCTPVPNAPCEFPPHVQTVPSAFSATEVWPAALTSLTNIRSSTWTGRFL